MSLPYYSFQLVLGGTRSHAKEIQQKKKKKTQKQRIHVMTEVKHLWPHSIETPICRLKTSFPAATIDWPFQKNSWNSYVVLCQLHHLIHSLGARV